MTLEIQDNGKGLPDELVRGETQSLGLLGMKERAMSLGGEVVFVRTGGTLVRARIPLGPEAEASGDAGMEHDSGTHNG